MSVVIVHDWRFEENGDVGKGFRAAEKYVRYLKEEADGMELSLWLRAREDPLRAFHVVAFRSLDAARHTSDHEASERFVRELYPEIDESSHTAPTCDVTLSSGGRLPEVADGDTELVTVVNEWRFAPEGEVDQGLQAAADYVDYFAREKPEVLLSLWLRDTDDPLHHFHVSIFDSAAKAVEGIRWKGTEEFAAKLYPQIDEESVDQPHCDVLLLSGGQLPRVGWPGAPT